jgi:hypothetical protein
MKKYVTPGNVLWALSIIMLIWYMNHDHLQHFNQIVNGVKNLLK